LPYIFALKAFIFIETNLLLLIILGELFMKRVIIALLLSVSLFGYGKNFFVSPTGNDAGSGTKMSPYASMDRARRAVQAYKKAHPKENVTVWFAGGVYPVSKTIVFTPEDSANDGQVYTYRAMPNQKPIFTAGIPILKWSRLVKIPKDLPAKARGHVLVANLKIFMEQKKRMEPSPTKATQMSQDRILTVFADGKMLPRARGPRYMLEKMPATVENTTNAFCFPKGMVGNWTDLKSAEIVGITSRGWVGNMIPLSSVDLKNQVAYTAFPSTYPFGPTAVSIKEKNVWIENSLALLDEPGEWVFDAKNKLLYLWPMKNMHSVTVPLFSEIIRLQGDIEYDELKDKPVKNIVFKGLTFAHGSRFAWHGRTGWGLQHDWERFDSPSAMMRFRGAENCVVEECSFETSGSSGLRLDLYAQNNKIVGNEFKDLGGVAILLAGYGPGKKNVNMKNIVENNYIHNIGLFYPGSPGIFVWQSGRNKIMNNELFDLPYTAICVSGRIVWNPNGGAEECSRTIRQDELDGRHLSVAGSWKSREKYLHARGNKILRNNIHHVMQVCSDGNAIYVSGAGANNLIEENYCHHCPSKFMNSAIRCDDDQNETIINRNIIYQIGGDGEAIQIKGENTITENLFVDPQPNNGHHRGIIRFYRGRIKNSIIQRNIFFVTRKDIVAVCNGVKKRGELQPVWRDTKADFNLYFNTQDPTWCVERLKTFATEKFEMNSIVADPMFKDVAHADFQFKKGSPALTKLKLKQPISIASTGILEPYVSLFKKKTESKKAAPVLKKEIKNKKVKPAQPVSNKG